MSSNFRTDRNRNPTAFTTDIAKQGGLKDGLEFEKGDPFVVAGRTYYTARLLGDPVDLTRQVIDSIGFYNQAGAQRWVYIGMPSWLWHSLEQEGKRKIIGEMYEREGGIDMKGLFV